MTNKAQDIPGTIADTAEFLGEALKAHEPKPGIQTTEFWGVVVYAAVLVANGYFKLGIPADQLMTLAGVIGTYAISRGMAKKGAQ